MPDGLAQSLIAPAAPAPSAPLAMLAELTHRCPLACPYCSNPLVLEGRADELSAAEWARVFDEAARLGVLQLHLSGGEPMSRRDIVRDRAQPAAAAGLYSNLITSGHRAGSKLGWRRLHEPPGSTMCSSRSRTPTPTALTGSPAIAARMRAKAGRGRGWCCEAGLAAYGECRGAPGQYRAPGTNWWRSAAALGAGRDRGRPCAILWLGPCATADALMPTRDQAMRAVGRRWKRHAGEIRRHAW